MATTYLTLRDSPEAKRGEINFNFRTFSGAHVKPEYGIDQRETLIDGEWIYTAEIETVCSNHIRVTRRNSTDATTVSVWHERRIDAFDGPVDLDNPGEPVLIERPFSSFAEACEFVNDQYGDYCNSMVIMSPEDYDELYCLVWNAFIQAEREGLGEREIERRITASPDFQDQGFPVDSECVRRILQGIFARRKWPY